MLTIAFTDGTIRPWEDDEAKRIFWHSSAHLMAEALEALYPGVKFGVGPAVETGFYYDVDLGGRQISDSDLKTIEDKMKELAKTKETFECRKVSKAEALDYFKKKGDQYKCELIGDLEDGTITFYTNGGFTDLCRGPHVKHVDDIKAVKLTAIAGAYWKGDQSRNQLTRIYGVSFPKKSMLDEYLQMMEEAKKRDHRKLGKEMELFTFSNRVGLGLPMWLPRGAVMRNVLENFLRKKQAELGYLPVVTPHIGSKELYVTSGHYAKYGKDSFQPIHTPQEGEEYMLKPMNCPHHCEIFRSSPRSYKDLPLRFAEFGTVYRYEQSGELHGLTRVRGFTQDDGHIFCTEDQILAECEAFTKLVKDVYQDFGFTEIAYKVATRPEMRIGEDAVWDKAEHALMQSLDALGIKYEVLEGEGAFYGPKIEYHLKDCLGRSWQCGTIQVDFQMPGRLGAEYVAEDNSRKVPVMLHRAILGSLERWIGMLIEEYAGAFPTWLAPVQCAVACITDAQKDYADEVAAKLHAARIRVQSDLRSEKINYKIRELSLQKIPYILVVGEKEKQAGCVAVRARGGKDLGSIKLDDFIAMIKQEDEARSPFAH